MSHDIQRAIDLYGTSDEFRKGAKSSLDYIKDVESLEQDMEDKIKGAYKREDAASYVLFSFLDGILKKAYQDQNTRDMFTYFILAGYGNNPKSNFYKQAIETALELHDKYFIYLLRLPRLLSDRDHYKLGVKVLLDSKIDANALRKMIATQTLKLEDMYSELVEKIRPTISRQTSYLTSKEYENNIDKLQNQVQELMTATKYFLEQQRLTESILFKFLSKQQSTPDPDAHQKFDWLVKNGYNIKNGSYYYAETKKLAKQFAEHGDNYFLDQMNKESL